MKGICGYCFKTITLVQNPDYPSDPKALVIPDHNDGHTGDGWLDTCNGVGSEPVRLINEGAQNA